MNEVLRVEDMIERIRTFVDESANGSEIVAAQNLILEAQVMLQQITNHLRHLAFDPVANVFESSNYLKLQSRLAVATASAIKHKSQLLKSQAAELRQRRLRAEA
jgi:vesicle coat complex subunit